MWTITLRLEIMDSNNKPVKIIECDHWSGDKTMPFFKAHSASEVFHLNRNNILSIVSKSNGNNANNISTY